jgi:nitrous oxidase accessory protein NosD
MKANIITISLWAALSFTPAFARPVTVIDHVPFTITASGEYELESDLTASGTDGIDVQASNVVINLNGHTLDATVQSAERSGINLGLSVNHVTVEDGTISGFFAELNLFGSQHVVKRLQLVNNQYGVFCHSVKDTLIQACYIVGTGKQADGFGIFAATSSGTQISDNFLSEFKTGIATDSSSVTDACAIIHNYVTNCAYGLTMSASTKYQGNVLTNCTTPFTGGIAVGNENG